MRNRGQKWRKQAFFGALTLVLALVATLAVDRWVLGGLGLPGSLPVAAPPDYRAQVENREFSYTLKANNRGVRYRTVPLTKPTGTYRMVILGDSMTEGAGVAVADRWSDRIEARLNGVPGAPSVELVNCAESGTSPFNYGQKLTHIGLDYDPDSVLLGLYFNDVDATLPSIDPRGMFPGYPGRRSDWVRTWAYRLWPHAYVRLRTIQQARTLAGDGGLVARAEAEAARRGIDDAVVRRWREAIPADIRSDAEIGRVNPYVVTYALTRPGYYRDSLDLGNDTARDKLRAMLATLDAIHDVCRKREIPFVVVLIPTVYQYDPAAAQRFGARVFAAVGRPMSPEWLERPSALQDEVAEWAAGRGVPMLDLWPAFRAAVERSEEPLNYEIDNHWTPAGHAVAAEAILDWLSTSGVVGLPLPMAARAVGGVESSATNAN